MMMISGTILFYITLQTKMTKIVYSHVMNNMETGMTSNLSDIDRSYVYWWYFQNSTQCCFLYKKWDLFEGKNRFHGCSVNTDCMGWPHGTIHEWKLNDSNNCAAILHSSLPLTSKERITPYQLQLRAVNRNLGTAVQSVENDLYDS